MHIKQIIISGFRSFRNQEEIEQFSPQHNVIVGRNGSGKSNFFNAIQFALLAPKFINLRQEDRQSLLYEGAGSSVLAAYVEVIFDNSDGRLSVDTEEVIIRRTVGQKKDEFFLNRRRIQKNEIISLLESAGFSKSNPYYIVQQGKVSTLCVMKDSDRLGLLKEIAGTVVYEERKAESLKILLETTNKQSHIEEVLVFIDERLGELEREKEELVVYDQLDRQRRALRYTLYSIELTKASERLETLEITRHDLMARQQQLYQKLREVQESLAQEEENSTTHNQELELLTTKRKTKVLEMTNYLQRKSELLIKRDELLAIDQERGTAASRLKEELEILKDTIKERSAEMAQLEPEYQSAAKLLNDYQSELLGTNSRIEHLYGRQGRGKQFKNIKERNGFLHHQIAELRRQATKSASLKQRLSEEAAQQEDQLQQEFNFINIAKAENEKNKKKINDLEMARKDLFAQRSEHQEQRKSSWKEIERLQEDIRACQADIEKYKHLLNASLPRQISLGLATVERIAEEMKLSRDIHSRGAVGAYFGPVIDNITLKSDGFRTAVEVAGGNGLFNVIVDSDRTAAMLMKELERRKCGRLTFLPLNQLRVQEISYPTSNDIRPLIDIAIDFDVFFRPAIQQIFSKKLLVKDLEVGSRFSREYSLDAVTRDGDFVNRKGGFEGGYRDERASKISNVTKIRECTKRLHVLRTELAEIEERGESIEANMNKILREIQRIETERNHLRGTVNNVSSELSQRSRQYEVAIENLAKRRSVLITMESELTSCENQIREYEVEISSEMRTQMNKSERTEVQRLSEEARNLQNEIEVLDGRLVILNDKRKTICADLRDNLGRRKEELELRLSDLEDQTHEQEETKGKSSKRKKSAGKGKASKESEAISLDLQYVEKFLGEVEVEVSEIDQRLHEIRVEVSKQELAIDSLRKDESRLEDAVEEGLKSQDRLLNKRNLFYENSEEKRRLIRELGSLPRKELDEYNRYSETRLLSTLREVNDHLKSYKGVNRKALDQYINFNQQRQQFVERFESLAQDKLKIQELMDGLDRQKEEAIWRTFQGVSQHFSEVFRELVPYGEGSLIMVKAAESMTESVEEFIREEKVSQGSYHGPSIDEFLGVRVKVSFSDAIQQFEMHQLSGGQKALVALAIIFAIQRCDPAPFYLFDEIDQALDANHRLAVARLIQKQAMSKDNPTQFITSTFRPELVSVANKCYGLALENRSSRIYPLPKKDAEVFVQNLLTEDESQSFERAL